MGLQRSEGCLERGGKVGLQRSEGWFRKGVQCGFTKDIKLQV